MPEPGSTVKPAACPTKVWWLATIGSAAYNYASAHLCRKKYGEPQQNRYAHEQAAILLKRFHRFFRGRDSMKASKGESLFVLA